MALVTCPECGKEISDMTGKCVHCGYRKGLSKKVKASITIAFLMQLTAIVLLVACSYIYVFQGNYYNYVYSEFGSEFDYSGYQVCDDDCFSSIFLKQNNTIDPEVEVTTVVKYTSYIVIAVGTLGVIAYLYALLREERLQYYWLIPVLAAGSLLIHLIEVSVTEFDMIGAQGYYVISPSIVWIIVIALEIAAAVLGKKTTREPDKDNKTKSRLDTSTTDGYVDAHGIFRGTESDAMSQDSHI